MIRPHPESELSLNLLVLGSDIIKLLKPHKESYVIIENILRLFLEQDARRSPDHFMDALTMLYVIGLLEYQDYRIRLRKGYGYTQLNLL